MALSSRLIVLMTMPPLLWAGNAVFGRMAVGHDVAPQSLNAWRWASRWSCCCRWVGVCWPLRVPTPRSGSAARTSPHWGCLRRRLQCPAVPGVDHHHRAERHTHRCQRPGVDDVDRLGAVSRSAEAPSVAGSVLSLLGVLVVVGRGDWQMLTAVRLVADDLPMLLAVSLWAYCSRLLARLPASMKPPCARLGIGRSSCWCRCCSALDGRCWRPVWSRRWRRSRSSGRLGS